MRYLESDKITYYIACVRMLGQLPEYGLTEVQAKVYYHLLKLGRTSATTLTKQVGVHRAEVYRILRELAEKGLVTEHKGKRPALFTPAPPEEALNLLLKQQTETLQRLRTRTPRLTAWLNSQAAVEKARPSVLLVDDDETIRKALTRTLSKEGFNVDSATNGKHALEKSQLAHYDVALVDIRLPDMDGIILLRMLKDESPEIKVIIITGYPSLENAINAVDAGAAAYITKPFKPADLLAKIREKLKA
jgi:CheY-like chemotaxis protein/predicted transcriptional regulator